MKVIHQSFTGYSLRVNIGVLRNRKKKNEDPPGNSASCHRFPARRQVSTRPVHRYLTLKRTAKEAPCEEGFTPKGKDGLEKPSIFRGNSSFREATSFLLELLHKPMIFCWMEVSSSFNLFYVFSKICKDCLKRNLLSFGDGKQWHCHTPLFNLIKVLERAMFP